MLTRYLATGALILAGIFTAYAVFYAVSTSAQMGGMAATDPTPPVKGLYKGKDVLFIHTEASDVQVADMLTRMMGPKVLVVPSLAKIPRALLADVYVFTNGVKGAGPFGFQVDVFDSIPGGSQYTPLRAVTLARWKNGVHVRRLGSVEEIQAAVRAGDVMLKRPGVVVNMPMIAWPGGQR